MKLWVKLTLDGLVRALRASVHDIADHVESAGTRRWTEDSETPIKRTRKRDAVRS